jgi:hypothetical protein
MKKNIRNGKYFGGREITYTFHVIEYQFPGLPHAHIVLCLADAPDIEGKNGEELISFVSKYFIAEMPRFEGDNHQNIYHEEDSPAYTDAYKRKSVKLVQINNTHQCSTAINGCKKNEGCQCKRGYSRTDTIPETFVDNVTNRAVYPCCLICDLKIVPYNLAMMIDWDSHLNVEYSGSAYWVYLYKGSTKWTLCGIVLFKLNTFFSHVFACP